MDDLGSLVDQLKNKVVYRATKAVEKAVVDPEANAHAEEKKAKEKPPPSSPPTAKEKATGMISKIISRVSDIILAVGLPILFASLIANESISYPPFVRIIFFVFTLFLCVISPLAFGAIGIYYLGKAAYHYYVNNMVEEIPPKTIRILPAFLSILPVTTRTFPESSLKSFLTYPFRYPKTERDAEEVHDAMDRYAAALGESFEYLEKVKSIPMYSKSLGRLNEWIKEAKEVKVTPSMPSTLPAVVPSAPPAEKAT